MLSKLDHKAQCLRLARFIFTTAMSNGALASCDHLDSVEACLARGNFTQEDLTLSWAHAILHEIFLLMNELTLNVEYRFDDEWREAVEVIIRAGVHSSEADQIVSQILCYAP